MSTSRKLDDLISPAYLEEQRRLHAAPRGYGGRGDKWAPQVLSLIGRYNAHSVLDYGAGQCTLRDAVASKMSGRLLFFWCYDPVTCPEAIPNGSPGGGYELVVCTDVLEHVEPEKIGAVLDHLRSLTEGILFTVISLVETAKTLSDGRQAHILLEDEMWWTHAMASHGFERTADEFPNPKPEKQFVATWRPI